MISVNDQDNKQSTQERFEVCRKSGLNAILRDWKELQPGELGQFEVVISIESFEHFCSVEEYFAGKRDEIYDCFFRTYRQKQYP